MREIIKPTLTLLIICFLVSLSLGFVNYLTKDTILQRVKIDAEEKRRQVIPEATGFEKIDNWQKLDDTGIIGDAYSAYAGQKLVGYVFGALPKGYGGEIQVTVGVTLDHRISGVKIGANKETPGLGSKASEGGFVNQYSGRNSAGELAVVKRAPAADQEIQAISGATITSKAVTKAVQASANLAEKLMGGGR